MSDAPTPAPAGSPDKKPREPKRVVSGMRPTGKLHLGHLHGAIKNWIAISQKAECFFFSADWHALTSDYADPSKIEANTRDMFADWIAAGLDPERSTLFIQSRVKQHAELYLLLGMIAPLGWLERVPTYKEQQENLREKDLNTHGFLGYPVLQTADVALYGADAVPVGQDQVSHLELAREIVRRFNFFYGNVDKGQKPVLVEPQPFLTEVPKIIGLDGRKMSKSYQNAIELGEDPVSARARLMKAVTDPARVRRTDPGNPEVCGIWYLHKAYSPPALQEQINAECRSAAIGCVDCKKKLLDNLIPELEKPRARRAERDQNPARLDELVQLGTKKAQTVAEATMQGVRDAMKLG
ncbi:MAG: tryptophan--tRNA ligase [Deltaproteobacteria bacterium]|nr:tryptophan--tRNA ligase [Deltaproteobacteria bacterium]